MQIELSEKELNTLIKARLHDLANTCEHMIGSVRTDYVITEMKRISELSILLVSERQRRSVQEPNLNKPVMVKNTDWMKRNG